MAARTRTSHRIGAAAADAVEFALLQDAEQFRLGVRGQIADLVEEDGAALGQLESADAPGDGAGEGTFLVAEQFALDEPGRQGGAVDLDERLVLPPAVGMDRPRNEFLARPRLARDEDGGVGCRHPPDVVQHGRQCRALSDDLLEIVDALDLFLQVQVLLFEPGLSPAPSARDP